MKQKEESTNYLLFSISHWKTKYCILKIVTYCKGTGNALQYLYIYLLFRSCRIWFRTNNSGAGKSSKFTKLVYAKFQWLIIPLSSGSFTHYERRKVCFPWSSSGSPGCTGWQWPAGRVSSPPPGL